MKELTIQQLEKFLGEPGIVVCAYSVADEFSLSLNGIARQLLATMQREEQLLALLERAATTIYTNYHDGSHAGCEDCQTYNDIETAIAVNHDCPNEYSTQKEKENG